MKDNNTTKKESEERYAPEDKLVESYAFQA